MPDPIESSEQAEPTEYVPLPPEPEHTQDDAA